MAERRTVQEQKEEAEQKFNTSLQKVSELRMQHSALVQELESAEKAIDRK